MNKLLYAILFVTAFVACKKEQKQEQNLPQTTQEVVNEVPSNSETKNSKFDIASCFKEKYVGSFMGDKGNIIMKLNEVVKQEGYNYNVTGATSHKGNEVPFKGTFVLDEKMADENKVSLKLSYDLKEADVENGKGRFSGYIIIDLPREGDLFLYEKAVSKFLGNYFFPNGKQGDCNFGSN